MIHFKGFTLSVAFFFKDLIQKTSIIKAKKNLTHTRLKGSINCKASFNLRAKKPHTSAVRAANKMPLFLSDELEIFNKFIILINVDTFRLYGFIRELEGDDNDLFPFFNLVSSGSVNGNNA